jgi:hypothetical protein
VRQPDNLRWQRARAQLYCGSSGCAGMGRWVLRRGGLGGPNLIADREENGASHRLAYSRPAPGFADHGSSDVDITDPQDPATFARSKLDWFQPERPGHREPLGFYRRLIALREAVPNLSDPGRNGSGSGVATGSSPRSDAARTSAAPSNGRQPSGYGRRKDLDYDANRSAADDQSEGNMSPLSRAATLAAITMGTAIAVAAPAAAQPSTPQSPFAPVSPSAPLAK